MIEINPRTWSWVGITNEINNLNLIQQSYKYFILKEKVEYSDSLNIKDGSIRFIRLYEDLINNMIRYDKNEKIRVGFFKWFSEIVKFRNVIPEMFEFRIFVTVTIDFIKRVIRHFIFRK